MLEPIPFAGMVEIDESFDRTASHMAGEYVSNTEPVAWMQSKTTELPDGCECMQSVGFFQANDDDIPLYTHPVQLTDEEILKEAESYGMNEKFIQDAPLFHAIKFARAILRKAQEK